MAKTKRVYEEEQKQLAKITRVEVIDDSGRAYANLNVKGVQLDYQDDERTLKIFVHGGGDEFIIR
jgi:hypothetical protein